MYCFGSYFLMVSITTMIFTRTLFQKFKIVAWPKEEYGNFYSGDSYIILRVRPSSSQLVLDMCIEWESTCLNSVADVQTETKQWTACHGPALLDRKVQLAGNDIAVSQEQKSVLFCCVTPISLLYTIAGWVRNSSIQDRGAGYVPGWSACSTQRSDELWVCPIQVLLPHNSVSINLKTVR